jgi:hypothetical protein
MTKLLEKGKSVGGKDGGREKDKKGCLMKKKRKKKERNKQIVT